MNVPTASAEKLENVVGPPRNPVTISRRRVADRASGSASPMTIPTSSPPTRLAASVPNGSDGKTGFRSSDRPHRAHAPQAAPTPTAAIFIQGMSFSF